MLEQEFVRINLAARKGDVMAGAGCERYAAAALLPGAALVEMAGMGAELAIAEVFFEVGALGIEGVVDRKVTPSHGLRRRSSASCSITQSAQGCAAATSSTRRRMSVRL